MRISDWSSDVCSSDLTSAIPRLPPRARHPHPALTRPGETPESPAHLRDNPAMDTQAHDGDALVVAGKTYRSRLLTGTRSEERRVRNECVSRCRSRWSPSH